MTRFFRTLSALPLWLMQGLGWAMGWCVFLFSRVYRQRFIANARQAGYGWHQWWRAVGPAGQLVTELPRLWFGSPVPCEWDGAHHVEDALAGGRGIVFLTPHLGCFEVTAQAYAKRFGSRQAMTVLFRPARQPWLRRLIGSARARPGLKTAPTNLGGVRQMIKALRLGQSIGLLPDQVPPEGLGVWAPFWGKQAYTMTLSARLAQTTDATIFIAWGERLSWGRGYKVHVQPLVPKLPTDAREAAGLLNQQLEELIRQRPQQYLWGYARYKQPAQLLDGALDA
jgi:KDO2-lipid IV(A) lauroyltransferase